VLRAELFAIHALGHEAAAKRLRVGDLEQSAVTQMEEKSAGGGAVVREQWYFTYVEVGRNAEGRKIQEGEDIFAELEEDEETPLLEESTTGGGRTVRGTGRRRSSAPRMSCEMSLHSFASQFD
jgi:hypothetical protein